MDEILHPPRILVLDRGFVLVARCPDLLSVGLYLECTEVRCIRRWGTSDGLTQLVKGPLANTVFDPVAPREVVPVRAILRVIDLEVSKWLSLYPNRSAGAAIQNLDAESSATTSKNRKTSRSA